MEAVLACNHEDLVKIGKLTSCAAYWHEQSVAKSVFERSPEPLNSTASIAASLCHISFTLFLFAEPL